MPNRRAIILAVAASCASCALLATVESSGYYGQRTDRTSNDVAEALDRIIQPRFQKFDGRFGVAERLLRVRGHDAARLRAETPVEQKWFAAADASGRDYVIAFLRCAHVPARSRYDPGRGEVRLTNDQRQAIGGMRDRLAFIDGSIRNPAGASPKSGYTTFGRNRAEWEQAARRGLTRLKDGEHVDSETRGWLLAMRPVVASQDACLRCHTDSSRGQTLGVMVYAVKKVTTRTTAGVNRWTSRE